MAIRDVVLLGFGANGSIPQVVTLGFFSAPAPDIASLSGCIHVSATLQGRVEIGPTLQGCARIQPTLTGTVETGP